MRGINSHPDSTPKGFSIPFLYACFCEAGRVHDLQEHSWDMCRGSNAVMCLSGRISGIHLAVDQNSVRPQLAMDNFPHFVVQVEVFVAVAPMASLGTVDQPPHIKLAAAPPVLRFVPPLEAGMGRAGDRSSKLQTWGLTAAFAASKIHARSFWRCKPSIWTSETKPRHVNGEPSHAHGVS